MSKISNRARLFAASVAIVVAGGVGIAANAATMVTPSNAIHKGMGIGEFGMTQSFFNGRKVQGSSPVDTVAARDGSRARV